MRLKLKLLFLLLRRSVLRSPCPDITQSILRLRVTFSDCGWRSMTNDRYHAIMDIGRLDLLLRFYSLPRLLWHRIHPFVYTVDIKYRKQLRCYQRYTLMTLLVGYDRQYFWLEHYFAVEGEVVAMAVSRNGLLYRGKLMPPTEQMKDIDRWTDLKVYLKKVRPTVDATLNFLNHRRRDIVQQLKQYYATSKNPA